MNSKIDAMAETFEARRADDEAAAIAAERIRSGAADQKEDGAQGWRVSRAHRRARQRLQSD
jgi:hypothetical protein